MDLGKAEALGERLAELGRKADALAIGSSGTGDARAHAGRLQYPDIKRAQLVGRRPPDAAVGPEMEATWWSSIASSLSWATAEHMRGGVIEAVINGRQRQWLWGRLQAAGSAWQQVEAMNMCLALEHGQWGIEELNNMGMLVAQRVAMCRRQALSQASWQILAWAAHAVQGASGVAFQVH